MLNISHNQLNKKITLDNYSAYKSVHKSKHFKYFNRFLAAFAIIGVIILFLPWTQTVSGTGSVTTLTPEQRPQTIQSVIPGKIEKWFVREGDYVSKGDTILFISEIKNEYQDDLLAYHAIKAMATGIPREGHSVVGQGTFRDGEQGWDALAREFIELKKAEEVELYVNHGATLVTIEHLADTKPDYLRSAGGAMARLFFL